MTFKEAKLESLDDVALTTLTDRASRHHDYMRTYEQILPPRWQPVRILEMGVLGGDGLRTWAKWFYHPQSEFIGIDIETHRFVPFGDERVMVFRHSQTDRTVWAPFDVLIDDASHFCSAQITAFEWYFPRFVKPGGLYILEDLHTYASPQHCDTVENIMQYLTRIAVAMQGRGPDASGKVDPTDRWCSIDTITFRKGMAIIQRSQ